MTRTIAPAPVKKSLTVNAPPAAAFEVFTAGMTRWWPNSHTILKAPFKEAVIEPFAGGRWFHRGSDGSESTIGPVIAWEPPSRIVLGWQLNGAFEFDPDVVTEVEVRFTPEGANATRVDLEHRHLERFAKTGEQLRAAVDGGNGWSALLEAYRQFASARP